ncbi:MAG: hypothetical protein FJ375_00815 [Pelagibacterales bacterium]|nr:hypothetical protein [Pelagibacterales bacterium]
MAKLTKVAEEPQTNSVSQEELFLLEQKKVRALEKIANSLDALTIWFEEIDKEEWSERLQYYLYEFYNHTVKNKKDNE